VYKEMTYVAALLYAVLGVLIMRGMEDELYINWIAGGLFVLVGGYLYLKGSSAANLVEAMEVKENKKKIARFFFYEYIFMSLGIAVGVLLLSGVLANVFQEYLPIWIEKNNA
jgi:uncharacterized membrane protein